jgi:phosphonate ABC transporter permease subunit PhnE
MNKKASPWKSLQLGLAVMLVIIIYAYGFEITKVNLEEIRSPQRQESLVRVTRALAQPDILKYEQDEIIINTPVFVPCPAGEGTTQPAPNTSSPYLILTPACGEPGEVIEVEGFNFTPNSSGPLRFVPGNDPANPVSLGRDEFTVDSEGHFVAPLTLPDRPSEEAQHIRATGRHNVGLPHFSQTAHDTWIKIVETVFLALLATTLGTILAIPLSFIAARNLMKPVKSPLASISLSVLGWPIGIAIGFLIVRAVGDFTTPLAANVFVNLGSVVVSPLLFMMAMRYSLPQVELTAPSPTVRLGRMVVLFLAVLVAFFGLYQLAGLVANLGEAVADSLGSFAFLGNFMVQLSDILRTITPVLGSLAAGATVSSFMGRLGQRSTESLSKPTVKTMNIILATLAGAVLFLLLGMLVEWLYQIGRLEYTFWGPAITGGVLGLALALFTQPKAPLAVGMVIYSITRTFLNALRSVEALVMAIVFVIAVGIGPFAGVLALGLHTIVSLAKLYSEQVESILTGPLEAVEATGANRLQTIVYAVIPQIVPPYISYTMYRWDINVRMSTIIGFVGGGGIGFLLQQNINLLNYRAASAQMFAIAIVVATMDYISSWLRERVI